MKKAIICVIVGTLSMLTFQLTALTNTETKNDLRNKENLSSKISMQNYDYSSTHQVIVFSNDSMATFEDSSKDHWYNQITTDANYARIALYDTNADGAVILKDENGNKVAEIYAIGNPTDDTCDVGINIIDESYKILFKESYKDRYCGRPIESYFICIGYTYDNHL